MLNTLFFSARSAWWQVINVSVPPPVLITDRLDLWNYDTHDSSVITLYCWHSLLPLPNPHPTPLLPCCVLLTPKAPWRSPLVSDCLSDIMACSAWLLLCRLHYMHCQLLSMLWGLWCLSTGPSSCSHAMSSGSNVVCSFVSEWGVWKMAGTAPSALYVVSATVSVILNIFQCLCFSCFVFFFFFFWAGRSLNISFQWNWNCCSFSVLLFPCDFLCLVNLLKLKPRDTLTGNVFFETLTLLTFINHWGTLDLERRTLFGASSVKLFSFSSSGSS